MPHKGLKVLAVDDEEDILTLLSFNLKKAGFDVVMAADGPEAIELAVNEKPGLILLDIMLPNMDGTEVLRRLKAAPATARIPIIMLTAKGEEVDKVVGFELGADDYITKPFSPRELILRIKAIINRTAGGAGTSKAATRPAPEISGVKTFGYLEVDRQRHRVAVNGAQIEITAREMKLLTALMDAGGRVLTRDTILDVAWGRDFFVTPRTVDTHIQRLRKKLKKAGSYIETVRGAGYRFADEGKN